MTYAKISSSQAIHDVIKERLRQEQKWGEQNHEYPIWRVILGEELGETDQEFLKTVFEGEPERAPKIREELVQVAAVALAMIECCDRNGWTKTRTTTTEEPS